MKQQYTILKNHDNTRLIIREFGELDKDSLSLLCEESYDDDAVSEAIKGGREKVIAILRTNNMYPPRGHAEKIADSVMGYYNNNDSGPVDIAIDEPVASAKDILSEVFLDVEEEVEIIDDILEDEFDGDSDDPDELKLDSSIKIADDDSVDVEDEL